MCLIICGFVVKCAIAGLYRVVECVVLLYSAVNLCIISVKLCLVILPSYIAFFIFLSKVWLNRSTSTIPKGCAYIRSWCVGF